jgi:acetylornithine deacetylase/succinyl-diaminopimelate desuccinylase-like protein
MAGGPPINIRVLLEGEEEIVGSSLGEYLRENSEQLASDFVLIWDGGFAPQDNPALVTGMRGILHIQLDAIGASQDLHSGTYGGVAPNPLNTLARVVADLKDRQGKIKIQGFYDRVRPLPSAELREWKTSASYTKLLRSTMDVPTLEGEAGYSPLARQWARPTLDVHGWAGGFSGEGVKSIIPSRATAKLSMRLVPDQDPEEIFRSLDRQIKRLRTGGVRISVTKLAEARPVTLEANHKAAGVARTAFQQAFDQDVKLVRSGGTIPAVLDFKESLNAQIVVSGLAQPQNGHHAPNERLSLNHFHKGTEMLLRFIYGLQSAAGD